MVLDKSGRSKDFRAVKLNRKESRKVLVGLPSNPYCQESRLLKVTSLSCFGTQTKGRSTYGPQGPLFHFLLGNHTPSLFDSPEHAMDPRQLFIPRNLRMGLLQWRSLSTSGIKLGALLSENNLRIHSSANSMFSPT